MRAYPVVDKKAATVLGHALRQAGYSEPAVCRLLGDDAYSGRREDVPVYERRLPQTHLGTVVRAFFLQLPVPTREATPALGGRAVAALEATALAEVGHEIVPRVRILPVEDLLIASDDYPEGEDPPDYVAAYTPATQVCDALTVRRRVARALDVGTGSGAQALLAARHARHVIATDVNPRALAYTQLNAALSGVTNIECRRGSLFEPVAGEKFDLITCNAPYVVSPENRWAYRDSGLQGDAVSELVVGQAAEHLNDDGFATLLVSWVADDADAPDERALAWTEKSGCDAWILPVWGADPIDHAATWNVDLVGDPNALRSALAEWTSYLAGLRVRWVTEGAVVLHRRAGRRQTVRIDELDEDTLEPAGEQIERAFAARARLSELRRRTDLFDARLVVAAKLHLEDEVVPRRGRLGRAHVHLAEGTNSTVDTTTRTLDIVAALDGRTPLGKVIEATARRSRLSEHDAVRLRREALTLVRELLELGALRFA